MVQLAKTVGGLVDLGKASRRPEGTDARDVGDERPSNHRAENAAA